jgi:hypothetical protein
MALSKTANGKGRNGHQLAALPSSSTRRRGARMIPLLWARMRPENLVALITLAAAIAYIAAVLFGVI